MQKVISVNLNGNAYQLDENAYEALRAYLDTAEAQLATDPDRAEIVADLQQAIAEKCTRFLAPHKTVVTLVEIEEVLREMGPVNGSAGSAGTGAPRDSTKHGAKRLYRIRENAMIAGICAGIGAYAEVDPTIVRVIFCLRL